MSFKKLAVVFVSLSNAHIFACAAMEVYDERASLDPSIDTSPSSLIQPTHHIISSGPLYTLLPPQLEHGASRRARGLAKRWLKKYGFDPFCVPEAAFYTTDPQENVDASMVERMSGAGNADNLRTPDFSAAGHDMSMGIWPTLYRRDTSMGKMVAYPRPSIRERRALKRSLDDLAKFVGVGYPGCFFPGAFARPAGAGYGGPLAQGFSGMEGPDLYAYGDFA